MSIDEIVLRTVQKGKPWAYTVWEPTHTIIVMGRGGTPEKEINTEACKNDNIPVYKRRTGGGTVVLSPGMTIFSLAKKITHPMAVHHYIQKVSSLIIEFLETLNIKTLCCQGLADICLNQKKILGAGLYLAKDNLFYQASLLVNPDLQLIDRYLPHPPKEPEYRKKRPHHEFITSLQKQNYPLTAEEVAAKMFEFWKNNIERIE